LKLQSPAPLKLNAIAIGDGGKLFPGQFVLALGNPFGVAAPDGAVSASWGIISSIRRRPAEPAFGEPRYSIVVQGRTLVQTDARLNMGSSGAALINLKGEMVGIGMALSAAIGFEAPGGFAQPTDDLTRRVLDTLAEGREVEYGFIGISFQPTVAMGGPGSLAPPRGVVVRSIELPSTQQAGLTPGDIVTEVNGRTIRDLHDLILVVGSLPVGTKLRTKVLRGESEKDLVLTLAKYPPRDEPIVTNKRPAWNGIRVDHLSTRIDASGFQFGDDQRLPMEGVVVREVLAGSPAYEKGVQVRQIVTQVNGKTVADPDQFDKMVAEESGPVRLTFEGGSEQVFGAGDEKKSNR
jgi:S1-C subfamily serine protease